MPSYVQDYVRSNIGEQQEALCFSTLRNLCIHDNNLLIGQVMTAGHLISEPLNYAAATRHSGYRAPMDGEIQALIDNDT